METSLPRLTHPAPPRGAAPSRRPVLAFAPLLVLVAFLVSLAGAPAVVNGVDPTPTPTASTMVTACDGVNVRTSASTTATAAAKLVIYTSVTVIATVTGGSYSTTCGVSVSGSAWVRISHVNGTPVSSLYGVASVYGAAELFNAAPAGTAPPSADPMGDELTRLLNLDRQALGLAPMLVDTGLAAIARNATFTCPTNASLKPRGRATDMADRSYFAHTIKDCRKSDGTTYGSIEILKTVFGYTGARSEILHWNMYAATASTYDLGCDINGANCRGGSTPTVYTVGLAQRNFMSSSMHRAAELNAYERVGCGAATVPGTTRTYFACLFSNGGSTTFAAPTASPTASATPFATPTPSATATATPTAVATATPAPSSTMLAKCDGVNLRTSTSTTATIKVNLAAGTPVNVNDQVTGSAWSTTCVTSSSGSGWYRITHVNGTTVSSLYGVSYLYAATGVLKPATMTASPTPSASPSPTPAPSASPTPTTTPTPTPTSSPSATPSPTPTTATPVGSLRIASCTGVNLRTSTSTTATARVQLAAGTPVATVATVSGGSWSTTCGTSTSGSSWYRITHVSGESVLSLYGVTYLYAATGTLTLPVAGTPGLTPIGANTTFSGRGWGHGVGMSQHGARGRAQDGQDMTTILTHYYPGATIGTIAADTQIRVLLLSAWGATADQPLTIYGRAGLWSVDGIDLVLPSNGRLRAIPAVTATGTTWNVVIDDSAGTVLWQGPMSGGLRVRTAQPGTQLQLFSKNSTYDRYRGALRVILGTKVDVVNELPLEDYLRGAVPAEMPSTYPAEALKAQAIAARSYAAYRLRPGVGTFDVYDDTRSQVYQGVKRETATTNVAVDATANQVLRSGTAIANTLYHSTGGGATENNENVFTSSTGAKTAGVVSYLRGSMDRRADGTAYDSAAPYATWTTGQLTQAQLTAIFGADSRTSVGTVVALDLGNRGVSGRLVSVTIIGTTSSKIVSGAIFTSIFNSYRPSGILSMRSTLVDTKPIS